MCCALSRGFVSIINAWGQITRHFTNIHTYIHTLAQILTPHCTIISLASCSAIIAVCCLATNTLNMKNANLNGRGDKGTSDRPHPIRGYTSLHVHVIPWLHLRTTFTCRLHRHTTSSVSYIICCVSIVRIVNEITRGNVYKWEVSIQSLAGTIRVTLTLLF